MTQEEKQLLFIDLCERLPYGVKCHEDYVEYSFDIIGSMCYNKEFVFSDGYERQIEQIKPYLRPLSSMTEEECKLYDEAIEKDNEALMQDNDEVPRLNLIPVHALNFLLSRHFDFRGLIDMGLALEAPVDMYKIK